MNDNSATAIIRRHLEAVTRMLLGSQMMKPGLAIIAADRLSGAETADLARMAKLSETDVICLEFDLAADEPDLLSITIVAPRDRDVHIYTGCRLIQGPGVARAKLLPREGGRGHFEILPGEIVHRVGTPANLIAGIGRAALTLRELVAAGVDVEGQVVIEALIA